MTVERGKLVLSKKGKPLVEIDGNPFNLAEGEVSRGLLDNLNDCDGTEVEFERVGGQPKKIREAGGASISPQPDVSAGARRRRRRGRRGRSKPGRPQEHQERREHDIPRHEPDFHNPYNFIPAPPRNTNDPHLGDHKPVVQDEFIRDRYSGSIRVKLTTTTPLLVPDT